MSSPPQRYIGCIGARSTTDENVVLMEKIGRYLVGNGHIICSGNATGSDQAFVRGANEINPSKVVLCIPWAGFEQKAIHKDNIVVLPQIATGEELELAERAHPNWKNLFGAIKKLMIRNAMIINRSCFVIANPNQNGQGGTWHAIRVANILGIPWRDINDKNYRKNITNKVG